jgi:hypothetical protein
VNYGDFLQQKRRIVGPGGIETNSLALPSQLYDWQEALSRWALRKGRAAIFADCGLGKTFMQVSWANALDVPTLILAPLCVAEQTVSEAAKLGIQVQYARDSTAARHSKIIITNYERLDKFDPNDFQAVVLDESSILKSFDGKTRTKLIKTFQKTPYRLCCSATPAPNDIAELANHAEFLGLMTRAEFLATWFVHDDTGWRMKRHAVQPFYRWLASWAIAMRRPSDLGYSDDGFRLPPLRIHDIVVEADIASHTLFPELSIKGISGRLSTRRGSLEPRLDAAVNLIHERGVSWLAWCGLNTESAALTAAIPNAVEVQGSDSYAEKAGAVTAFVDRRLNVLITKISILGYGMNFQHCSHMLFMGIGDSFEQYYQGIRRCWRFGQQHPVDVYIVVSEAERIVVENVRRKEQQYSELSTGLVEHMTEFEREELCQTVA